MRKKELERDVLGLKRRIDFLDQVLEFCTERIEVLERRKKQEEKNKKEVR